MKLKFVDQETFEEYRILFDFVSIESVYDNETFNSILNRKWKKICSKKEALEFMEVALNCFEEREEYDLCQTIINNWPELIKKH